ncbi:MAG TPA: DNA repair protein RecN [Bacteroidales bacterium]|nr:MAG: DNA repair protein RecN [Bacteroidetes bacterium GWE2_42_24]OFY29798.1 MAG: DNA repair protein RecN [Bacteroidetes bacterium GWF2_43_11]HBZ66390.1 DNA repair protein RecN [Bacteroidales bacterium]
MLSELFIENYILIPRLEIRFETGFNAITGETGAGKSILLGALSLILGQRADSQSLLNPAKKCVIEGVFNLTSPLINNYLNELDLDVLEQLIIRREIAPGGKSRAFINDTPVQLSQLKSLGDLLVDVHSQHSTLYLNESGFQLSVIDHFAGNDRLLNEYHTAYSNYQRLQHHCNELSESARKQAAEVDFLQFQLGELSSAKLLPNEKEGLEEELETLTHAEEIKSRLHQVAEGLNQGDEPVVSQLKAMLSLIRQVATLYPSAAVLLTRLNASIIELDDLGDEMMTLTSKINYDPERIGVVQERLDLIYRLEHKHHVSSTDALISLYNDIALRLQDIQSVGDNLLAAEKELVAASTIMLDLAGKLTESRRKVFESFEKSVLHNLGSIGMATARLKVDYQSLAEVNENGADRIVFLFNANPDGELRPIAKVASGGELSRLMLSVKAALAKRSLVGTIILDEIDSGVSGDIATRLGTMMQRMGEGVQLIAITHLPQIAAKARSHYKVLKINTPEGTRSEIQYLAEVQRIDELAGMLGGASPSAEARATAKQLMQ